MSMLAFADLLKRVSRLLFPVYLLVLLFLLKLCYGGRDVKSARKYKKTRINCGFDCRIVVVFLKRGSALGN